MRIILIFTIAIILSGCGSQQNEVRYSFFVAGHVYGSIYEQADGFYSKFIEKRNLLDSLHTLEFGVLTGDIVQKGSEKEWEAIQKDIGSFDFPIYLSPGNHDYKNPELLKKHFPKTYNSFISNNDLHIILDGNINGWSIKDDQLIWLQKTIDQNKSVNNIFLYIHQVIWKDPEHPFKHIKVNSTEGLEGQTNFWKEIFPLLQKTHKEVFVFSGDAGGAPWSTPKSYDKFDKVHLFTSGMGGGIEDNFILVNVTNSGQARIDFVQLDK